MSMHCPVCEAELAAAQLERLTVFDCPAGHGTWLDAEELRQAKDRADHDIRWLDDDLFAATIDHAPGTRPCPVCGETMPRETYPLSMVGIDVCVADHGVWLDQGEFQGIVTALENVTHDLSASEYEHAAAEQFKEIVTGPESKLSELKDFLAVFRLFEMRLAVEHPGAAAAVQQLEQRGL